MRYAARVDAEVGDVVGGKDMHHLAGEVMHSHDAARLESVPSSTDARMKEPLFAQDFAHLHHHHSMHALPQPHQRQGQERGKSGNSCRTSFAASVTSVEAMREGHRKGLNARAKMHYP